MVYLPEQSWNFCKGEQKCKFELSGNPIVIQTNIEKRIYFKQIEDLECDEKEVEKDTLPVTKLNGVKASIRVKRIYYKYDYKRPDGKIEKRTKQVFNKLQLDLSKTEFKDKKF